MMAHLSNASVRASRITIFVLWLGGKVFCSLVNENFWKGIDAIKSSPSRHKGQVNFSCFTHWSKHLRWKRWWQHLVLIVLVFSWRRQIEQIIGSLINENAYILKKNCTRHRELNIGLPHFFAMLVVPTLFRRNHIARDILIVIGNIYHI